MPDQSRFYEGREGADLKKKLEDTLGPGAPTGHLADGRPFVKFGELRPPELVHHYWLDPADLDSTSPAELLRHLQDNDVQWPPRIRSEEVEVMAVPTRDHLGRPIIDVQVRYPPNVRNRLDLPGAGRAG